MESCLYEGHVTHRRHEPVEHTFRFPLFMLYLDLAELPGLFRRSWLWSAERPALAWFRRADHLGDPSLPLERCVRDRVEECTGRRPEGPIRLLTHLRYAGFVMNPVSLYYCFDREGRELEAVLAEVHNTPWGEQHCYVLPGEGRAAARGSEFDAAHGTDGASSAGSAIRSGASRRERAVLRAETPKEFHVSPFMGMDMHYAWRIGRPDRTLGLGIANHAPDGTLLFDAALALERRELSAANRARALLRHPFMTLQVVAGIYWQALRLRLKGAPFHPHPGARPSAGRESKVADGADRAGEAFEVAS